MHTYYYFTWEHQSLAPPIPIGEHLDFLNYALVNICAYQSLSELCIFL